MWYDIHPNLISEAAVSKAFHHKPQCPHSPHLYNLNIAYTIILQLLSFLNMGTT